MLEAAAYLVSEGYALRDVLDYEDGVTAEQLLSLHVKTFKLAAQRSKAHVQETMVAIGSLFDAKVLKKFEEITDRIIQGIEGVEGQKKSKEQTHREAMIKTMQELGKLNKILG